MISIKQISPCECENCKRVIPLTLEYEINDKKIRLCEDCSNGFSNLHCPCVIDGKGYVYHNDEIVEVSDLQEGLESGK